ncbi:putative sterol dehydrogenase [Dentipellis sp. KUC8613]|nr:putative sterol dehydrogenase [Dentipellis sp. KUC8613]
MSSQSHQPESYLVVGGAGFVGSYIAQALVDRGEEHVAVYDSRVPDPRDLIKSVVYYCGDICDEGKLVEVLNETAVTTVFHVVSPRLGLPTPVFTRVNVQGTRTLLNACRDKNLRVPVSKFIYTSSTGVVWTGKDLINVSEDQVAPPKKGYDIYHHTKAIAERMVLDADNIDGMRTVALRPCGVTGPRDRQMLLHMANALARGEHKVQIGDNTNLVDWVYAGNVADAHLLAADRLPLPFPSESSPTSVFKSSAHPDPVAGQAFFITNGTPMRQWDFSRMVWRALGAPAADFAPGRVRRVPRWTAMLVATLAEAWAGVRGRRAAVTRLSVSYATATQVYDIDKARKALGYEPKVSIEEMIEMTAKWWKERGEAEYLATAIEAQGKKDE